MKNFWRQLKFYLYQHRREFLLLIGIALIVRGLYLCTHLAFTQDQVRDVLFIKEKLHQRDFFIPFGPAAASYSNFYVLPFFYYLQLFAHLIFANTFYAMNVLILLLESISPLFIYYLLHKTGLKSHLCFLGSLLYIFTPGIITFSSIAWNPNLVPFFTLILLIGGLWYLLEDRLYGLFLALLAMVFLTGLHFQWFVLLPFVAVIAVKSLWQVKKTWKTLLLGLLCTLLLMSPYLYQELTHNYQNLSNSLHFLTAGPVTFERISKPLYLFFFFPNYYNRLFFGEQFVYHWTWLYENYSGPELVLVINSLFFWFLVAFSTARAYHCRHRLAGKYLGFTALIFLSMAIFLRFYKGDKPDYFLNVFAPFIFIWLLQPFTLIKKQVWQNCLITVVILLSTFLLWQQPWYNQYRDFQTISNYIKDTPDTKEIVVLNQEVERPIRYFLPDENYVATPSGTLDHTIFVCQASQACLSYRPNLKSKYNLFKYDWVTPADYTFYFPYYDAILSHGWHTDSAEGFLVVNTSK